MEYVPHPLVIHMNLGIFGGLERPANGAQKAQIVHNGNPEIKIAVFALYGHKLIGMVSKCVRLRGD
jgi:hypothetical protein